MAAPHTRTPAAAPARRGARRARLAAGLASLSLLAGCSFGPATPEATVPDDPATQDEVATSTGTTADEGAGATSTPTAGGDAPEGLERFYAQQVEWTTCESIFECASVTVPIDYAEPQGATIDIALLRAPAKGESRGSLLINPGGPGASGVDYAMTAGAVISDPVRAAYDIVGFDPRGVGRSAPVNCLSDAELDAFFASDLTPDDEAERTARAEILEGFATGCVESAPELAPHLSTVEAARDLDVIRATLGEETMDYLGGSYGTYLGTVYANLFPDRVGRFVLDGAMDPTLDGPEQAEGQAAGFERATRAYVEDCVAQGACPLGPDVDTAMTRIPAFLAELDERPLPVANDTVSELTEGWAYYGIVNAMYSPSFWPILTQAFTAADQGDGTLMMFLANAYARRSSDGTYYANIMEAFQAIGCLVPASVRAAEELDEEERIARYAEVSPTWARYFGGNSPCRYWPVDAAEEITDYSAPGAPPILVIGTTRDPATPYEWAEGLAEVLESGVLLTYDGDGHTAYGRSNECLDGAVDEFLLEGAVPQEGLRC